MDEEPGRPVRGLAQGPVTVRGSAGGRLLLRTMTAPRSSVSTGQAVALALLATVANVAPVGGELFIPSIISGSGTTPIEGNSRLSMPTDAGQGDGSVISVNYKGDTDSLPVTHAVECCGGLIYLNPLQEVIDGAFRHFESTLEGLPNDPELRTLRICPPKVGMNVEILGSVGVPSHSCLVLLGSR